MKRLSIVLSLSLLLLFIVTGAVLATRTPSVIQGAVITGYSSDGQFCLYKGKCDACGTVSQNWGGSVPLSMSGITSSFKCSKCSHVQKIDIRVIDDTPSNTSNEEGTFTDRYKDENQRILEKYGQPSDHLNDEGFSQQPLNQVQENQTSTELPAPVVTPTGISVSVDYKLLDLSQPPVVVDGTTLVPLRAISEALGAKVTWNPDTNEIDINRADNEVILTLDKKTAYVASEDRYVEMSQAPTIIGESTMVPLRFISEALDAIVNWNERIQLITIYTRYYD